MICAESGWLLLTPQAVRSWPGCVFCSDFPGFLSGRGEGCAVCLGGSHWQGEFLLENRELGAFLDRSRAISFFATSCLASPIARWRVPRFLRVYFSAEVFFQLILGSRASCWPYHLGLDPPLDWVHGSTLHCKWLLDVENGVPYGSHQKQT